MKNHCLHLENSPRVGSYILVKQKRQHLHFFWRKQDYTGTMVAPEAAQETAALEADASCYFFPSGVLKVKFAYIGASLGMLLHLVSEAPKEG